MTAAYYAKNRSQWRAWLQKHHRTASEIWCVFYKKHTGTASVSYDEAVEEALCFGWVDGTVKRMDEDRYAQRFTPRKPSSRWSASNIARMKEMISVRKVTAAGYTAFAGHTQRKAHAHPARLPADLVRRFRKASKAWKNFEKFPPGYKRLTAGWVASAKREETKHRRLEQLISACARNERIAFI